MHLMTGILLLLGCGIFVLLVRAILSLLAPEVPHPRRWVWWRCCWAPIPVTRGRRRG